RSDRDWSSDVCSSDLTAPRQVMEKVQAGLVTPMQVLNDQQPRLFGCRTEEEMSQGGEETTFLLLRIKWGQRGEIRRQGEQVRKRSEEHTSELQSRSDL